MNTKMIKAPYFVFLLLCVLCWHNASAAVQAHIDRNRMSEGETLGLTLTMPGDLDDDPDLSPLQQDFDVLNRSQSSQTSIINGTVDSKRIWRLLLSPKRSGNLQIPPLRVGAETTRGFSVEVLPADSQVNGDDAPPVFIETEATPQSPYVQGQVIYSVRIFSRLNLRQASLTEPDVQSALVERLGEDKSYTSFRNGRRYQVIERRYALFPQASGTLEINSPTLSAAVPVEGRNRTTDRFFGGFPDIGGMFEETRPLRLRGKRLQLDIRPQPPESQGGWLPATALSLDETWSPEPAEVRVGEPLTRTLTIRAKGLSASQLPDLASPAANGLKVYPDQPQTENKPNPDGLEAIKQIKMALVPTHAGLLQLPEIRLNWWNTETDREMTAVIPARSFKVFPAPVQAPAPTTVPPAPLAVPAPDAAVAPVPVLPTVVNGVRTDYWPWISLALAALWLLTLLAWLLEHRRRPASRKAAAPTTPSVPATSMRQVKQAFGTDNPSTASKALLAWAAGRWPEQPPRGLDALARRIGDEGVGTALRELNSALYANTQGQWNGKAVFATIEQVLKKAPAEAGNDAAASALPALYPS